LEEIKEREIVSIFIELSQ